MHVTTKMIIIYKKICIFKVKLTVQYINFETKIGLKQFTWFQTKIKFLEKKKKRKRFLTKSVTQHPKIENELRYFATLRVLQIGKKLEIGT